MNLDENHTMTKGYKSSQDTQSYQDACESMKNTPLNMDNKMKFERDSLWHTRNGNKAQIVFTDASEPFPIIAVYPNGGISTHTFSGSVYMDDTQHPLDLISKWEEPAPKKERLLAYISPSAGDVIMRTRENAPELWERAPWLDEPEVRG